MTLHAGRLAACLLIALALPQLALASTTDAIVAAVKRQAASFKHGATGSLDAAAGGNPVAGTADLGVKGPVLQAKRMTKRCGTVAPTDEERASVQPKLKAAARLQAREDAARAGGTDARLLANQWGPSVKTVNVYWHVIRSGNAYSQGNLPRAAIDQQIALLNQKFQPGNIQFQLVDVDYTTNAEWFRVQQGTGTESAMKAALHKGTMKDLNVYSARPNGSGGEAIAGFTKLPMFAQNDPVQDGSIILFDTLPGGSQYGMNMGMTLVHEAGHWLGLLHTFDNGCDTTAGGDHIGDTPYEASASFDCTPKNTCPGIWGMDPIQNPMNYSPDNCMTQFTTMQYKRMRQEWYAFRQQ